MTELQKISSKTLQKISGNESPLLVMDRKSGKNAFVLLDYDAYERLKQKAVTDIKEKTTQKAISLDFRAKGLLWDRTDMSNRSFRQMLNNPDHPEYSWAVTRLFERLPSQELWSLYPLATLARMFGRTKLRPSLREPWKHAINYHTQKT